MLPTISKVFEKLLCNQFNTFIEKKLSPSLCGFRKGYSTQHALLDMLNKWQSALNDKGKVGAILMDLSKAFDCLPHNLLIAKLGAYGIGKKSLKFIQSYLNNRKHRVKIGSHFSTWATSNVGVPQGSIWGPTFFNVFINDLILMIVLCDICNFADDNSLYAIDKELRNVIKKLLHDLDIALEWFKNNEMVANPEKFQVIFPNSNLNLGIHINGKL